MTKKRKATRAGTVADFLKTVYDGFDPQDWSPPSVTAKEQPTRLKAIETSYMGHRFRSRLEARWAAFYYDLGIEYEYEKECYDLGGNVTYLPDFWLPRFQCWVEIKGKEPTEWEAIKADRLAVVTNFPVLIFFGSIRLPADIYGSAGGSAHAFFPDKPRNPECPENSYAWCECPECRRLGICYLAAASELTCKCMKKYKGPTIFSGDTWLLREAYKAALSERFGT